VDPGVIIHSLANDGDSTEPLVTVHIHSPPLPEVRRYAVTHAPPAAVFLRSPPAQSRVIAIIGGGFTGTMTLANLLRLGDQTTVPLHIVLIDLLPAFGEGIAYRTNDARHLLNVPANRMSAWPDRPDDFLAFARSQDPSVSAGDFLPRKIYGRYVRQSLLDLAKSAPDHVSVEIVRDEATHLAPSDASEWTVHTAAGRKVDADLAVVAVGHRPPDDSFAKRWLGPRTRFVADPWAALVLSQIGPTEPVLLLGSGLTAVDAILTLNRSDRTAPLIVVSRRGLLPLSHLRQPQSAADLSELVAYLLDPATPLTVRRLVSTLRQRISGGEKAGTDWRQVVDGLRPVTPRLWQRMNVRERSRFLTHFRPFWEVHRHRMAPDIADTIDHMKNRKILNVTAGALVSAAADSDGVNVTLSRRGSSVPRTVRVSWVLNCTGPGVHNRHSTHPIVRSLIDGGILCDDELGLGLRTDGIGRAVDVNGNIRDMLLVAGTLRKSTLWESTAVPELRQQAQTIAQTALETLRNVPARRPLAL